MIRAELHDDNYNASARFDATEWFEQASDEQLKDLIECNYAYDYPADSVGEYFAGKAVGEPHTIDDIFTVCQTLDLGFEVSIESEDAINWIREHKPQLEAALDAARP